MVKDGVSDTIKALLILGICFLPFVFPEIADAALPQRPDLQGDVKNLDTAVWGMFKQGLKYVVYGLVAVVFVVVPSMMISTLRKAVREHEWGTFFIVFFAGVATILFVIVCAHQAQIALR